MKWIEVTDIDDYSLVFVNLDNVERINGSTIYFKTSYRVSGSALWFSSDLSEEWIDCKETYDQLKAKILEAGE